MIVDAAPLALALLAEADVQWKEKAATVAYRACWTMVVAMGGDRSLGCDYDGLFINNSIVQWMARDSSYILAGCLAAISFADSDAESQGGQLLQSGGSCMVRE